MPIIIVILLPGVFAGANAAQVGFSFRVVSYLSAHDAARMRIARVYPGAGSTLSFMTGVMGTSALKENIVKFALNQLHVNALMIAWRRQYTNSDPGYQAEAPLNSANLNPTYIAQLDQWVTLSKQYGFYIIFDEWFSPMLAKSLGEWTGFSDATFQQHWQTFYYVLAKHFAGNSTIAGFLCCEDVVQNDTWPYADSGSASFNTLWNAKMTNMSLAIHQADSNFNYVAEVTIDWSGGFYTLGSKAMYPNAWHPLADTNQHVLYRAQWNPTNAIKSASNNPYYPYDGGLTNGGANWINQTGLPFTMAVELNTTDWTWDSAAYTWETGVLNKLNANGIGVDFCTYDNQTATDHNPNALFDQYGNELQWGIVYGNWAVSIAPAPSNYIQTSFYPITVALTALTSIIATAFLAGKNRRGHSRVPDLRSVTDEGSDDDP
jgi:hypothetical protein